MSIELELKKYPRTHHIEGSKLQQGDEDLSQIPFSAIKGKHIAVEEKIDGANSAVSFNEAGELLLQSRGHYLTGGYRERHYNLMKQWANVHRDKFYEVLGSRYIMYGEWMYAKHTVFYDALPHYFMEFDIFDRETKKFLDTPSRRKLVAQMPVVSVPVLKEGIFQSKKELLDLIGPSNYIREGHHDRLREYCLQNGLDPERACQETDSSILMEGLYIKVEADGEVKERMKFVRASFLQTIAVSPVHWLERPIIPNQLSCDIGDLFLGNN